MKTIRQSIFETNSSSSHSITISRSSKLLDSIGLEDDGSVHIYPGDFGWGVDVFKDPETKASYCYTYAENYAAPEKFNLLTEVLLEQTGAKKVIYHKEAEPQVGSGAGYIDHQSQDTCEKAFRNKETLKRFIFNPESILIIGNDNT